MFLSKMIVITPHKIMEFSNSQISITDSASVVNAGSAAKLPPFRQVKFALLAAFAFLIAAVAGAHANTWSGNVSGSWTNTNNWQGGLLPLPWTDLTVVFPTNTPKGNKAQYVMTNNFPNTTNVDVRRLLFQDSGYVLRGNPVRLRSTIGDTPGIDAEQPSGSVSISNVVNLAQNAEFKVLAGATLAVNSNIVLGTHTLTLKSQRTLFGNLITDSLMDINGTISGTGGVVIDAAGSNSPTPPSLSVPEVIFRTGGGLVRFDGPQTYTGPTTVTRGELRVGAGLRSALTAGSGTTVSGTGVLSNGLSAHHVSPGDGGIGTLTVRGGLVLSDNLRVEVSSTASDRVTATTAVTLGPSSALEVVALPGFNPIIGTKYFPIVLEATGLARVNGSFSKVNGNAPSVSGFLLGNKRLKMQTERQGADGAGNDISLTVVNTVPTIAPITNQTINEDSTANVSISADSQDAGQATPTITATSDNPTLLPSSGIVISGGTQLTLTPAPNQHGTARVTVVANDGLDAATTSFTLTVNPVNDAPSIAAIPSQNTSEDTSLTVNLAINDPDGPNGLLVGASSSNTGVIPNNNLLVAGSGLNRTLTVTPAAERSGTANITVSVRDGGGLSSSTTFALTVAAVNDPPTIDPIGNVTVAEDSGEFTVDLTGISAGPGESQAMSVSVSVAPGGIIDDIVRSYSSPQATGSLLFKLRPNAFGSATVTVTVLDRGNPEASAARVFTVTVTPVNDAPVFNPIADVTVDQDSGQSTVNISGISAGGNESQTLLLTALSSNPTLVDSPSPTYTSPQATGSLRFTPNPNQHGSATMTVTLQDGGLDNNLATAGDNGRFERTFAIVVRPASADLAALTLSTGSLRPIAPGVFNYSTRVPDPVAAMNLTPTAEDSAAKIKVNGIRVTSGTLSGNIPLSPGPNPVTIEVASRDNARTNIYSLNVIRTVDLAGMDTVPVGDAGNAAHDFSDSINGFAQKGAVSYEYRIGTTAVTHAQYAAFLNAVATVTNSTNDAYLSDLFQNSGIDRVGAGSAASPYRYSVAESIRNKPVNIRSWFSAARFCNWMHNGATNGADTETGAYTLLGATSERQFNFTDASSRRRPEKTSVATWWIPSVDEWYKAAFYKGGGASAGYWLASNQSDSPTGGGVSAYGTLAQGSVFRSVGNSFVSAGGELTDTFQGVDTLSGLVQRLIFGCSMGDEPYSDRNFNFKRDFNEPFTDLNGNSLWDQFVFIDSGAFSPMDVQLRVATLARPALASLTLGSGTLTPAFHPATTSYSAAVPRSTAAINIAARAADSACKVTVNERQLTPDAPSASVDLAIGRNDFTITVTSPEGAASTSYNLVVFRSAVDTVIETVVVGDAGNAAFNGETRTGGSFIEQTSNYGAVAQDYRIGKYEVTIAQYAEFLNAVARTNPAQHIVDLWNPAMFADKTISGINRAGSGTPADPFVYTVAGPQGVTPVGATSPGNRPITYVSWFDAARFANWMHNGATATSDTETGAYTLNGATTGIIEKNPQATWFIPSEDQWFKAAYYRGNGTYQKFAVGNFLTNNNPAPNHQIQKANYVLGNFFNQNDRTYAVTGLNESLDRSTNQNYLTDVGAYGTTSRYGTFDQTGNVEEWNDAVDLNNSALPKRVFRGGSWVSRNDQFGNDDDIGLAIRSSIPPTQEARTRGFRLASIAGPALSNLRLDNGTNGAVPLSPAFAPATTSYTATVGNRTESIALTALAADASTSSIAVNGQPVVSGNATAVPLQVGLNDISIIVSQADGSAVVYNVAVERPAGLASLSLSKGTVSPAFDWRTTNYTANVPREVGALQIRPTATASTIAVRVNEGSTTDTPNGKWSEALPLRFGTNTITIEVTSLDGKSSKTYVVTVNRAVGTNANLKALALSTASLNPVFAAGTLDYSVSVPASTSGIRVRPSSEDRAATITVDGSPVKSGTLSSVRLLNAGRNVIRVVVTAQDGTTSNAYTITVTKGN